MVARLTPDQKAACSNHVGVSLFFPGSKIDKCICFLICIAVRVSKGIRLRKYVLCVYFVLATGLDVSPLLLGSLSKPRRRRQRERH